MPIHTPTQQTPNGGGVQRAMSVDNHASPFGSQNYFDRCTDELMSLHYGGVLDLLDWMNFSVTDEHREVFEFISYIRPEYDGGTATAGHLSNACAEPNGVEFGTAKLAVEDFGRYGRKGPTREIMKPMKYCRTDPVRRLDGSPVTDEREWDLRFATDVLLQDVRRDLVTGNASTAGQFGGLEHWVKTGYAGPNGAMLDSYVVNWNGNGMNGGAGVTVNGSGIASTYKFIDVLLSLFRRIKQRIAWARSLANQRPRIGDIIIAAPTHVCEGLLDAYTQWSVVPGVEFHPMNLQQMEARTFREQLVATGPQNLFGHGYIALDGVIIPLLAYDWGLIKGPALSDVYLLTGAIGGTRIWSGQHLSASSAASAHSDQGYFTVDGGRILGVVETENECRRTKIWMHPRIFCRAPWAQIRFQNVRNDTPGGVLSSDPTESSFFPLSSFNPAVSS